MEAELTEDERETVMGDAVLERLIRSQKVTRTYTCTHDWEVEVTADVFVDLPFPLSVDVLVAFVVEVVSVVVLYNVVCRCVGAFVTLQVTPETLITVFLEIC